VIRQARFTKLLAFSKAILRLRALDVRMPSNPKPDPRSFSSASAVKHPWHRLSSRWLALAVLVLPALTLSACGGSSPSTSSAASEQQAEVKLADFAKCLREHGVDATASTGPGGEGHALRVRGAGGHTNMEAAQRACKKYQPEPEKVDLSPQQKVAQAEAVEKFAKCMREHGIEVHASSSEGRISIQIHGKPGAGPNPESPAFQKAQQSCQKLLPFKGPGGRANSRTGGPGSTESAGSATGG
jgi:hypothetical protein